MVAESSVILVGCSICGKNPDDVSVFKKVLCLLLESYLSRSILKSPDKITFFFFFINFL